MRPLTTLFCLLVLVACSENESTEISNENPDNSRGFVLCPADSCGVYFTNLVKEDETNNYFTNQYVFNGGGVAVGDVNNDGLPDLFFTGNHVADKLYINKGGLKFSDVTSGAGIQESDSLWSTGVNMIDINADGWLDIYVCRAGHAMSPAQTQNLFYLNKGDGTFVELAAQLGLNDAGFSTQSSFFDYDNDGDLDLYVMNYPGEWNADGVLVARSGAQVPPRFTDNLYRNDGNAQFTRVSYEAGINNYAFGLGLATSDFNGDGWLDIYVGNDYQENDYLYINNQDGTFSEKVREFTNHNSQSSMGLDLGDINNDGLQDLFVAEMLPADYKRSKVNMASMNPEAFWTFIEEGMHYQYMRNVLQLNTGMNFFSDVAQMSGVAKTDWSWSPFFADLDNDADQDLFVSNGIKRDMMYKDATKEREKMNAANQSWNFEDAYNMIPSTKLSNFVYRNDGELTFANSTDDWGLGQLTFSNGAIYSDLDRDGDLDVIVNNLDDRAYIYENRMPENNWLAVSLQNAGKGNRFGVNSLISCWSDGVEQLQEIRPSKGFQSAGEGIAHFGLGKQQPDSLVISWYDGTEQVIRTPKVNNYHVIDYAGTLPQPVAKADRTFEQVQDVITFEHVESRFDDFQTEILLPHRMSTMGPCLAIGDVDGKGSDDIYVGGSAGKSGQLIVHRPVGPYINATLTAFTDDSRYEDQGCVLFDVDNNGTLDLYVVSGSTEFSDPEMFQDRLYINKGFGVFQPGPLPTIATNGSVVVSGDFDGDTYLDLFVGGGCVPGQYPKSDPSIVLKNNNGTLEISETLCQGIDEIGMVSDACAQDFDNDGYCDLLVVGEWMEPMLWFGSSDGLVRESLGIENMVGWWSAVEAGDVDGDGDTDFVLGNMGLNHKFRPTPEDPFHIYTDDFDSNGQLDIVLACHLDDETLVPVRGKQCMSEQMPFISEEKFNTYEEFASSDLQTILGKDLADASIHFEATNFASGIIYNDQGDYRFEPFPAQMQVSSINGIVMLDLDEDGILEILVAGNRYETEVETSRADASIGALLDDGQVILNSGFFAPGNVKDIRLVSTSEKQFVAVANNQGPLQLFEIK